MPTRGGIRRLLPAIQECPELDSSQKSHQRDQSHRQRDPHPISLEDYLTLCCGCSTLGRRRLGLGQRRRIASSARRLGARLREFLV